MSFCNFKTTENSDDDEDFIIDDSFSSDYHSSEFRTNSSSSLSLKWSLDARKQNEEDWLDIEKILYGEECLPNGSCSFSFIIDRNVCFFSNAHLRVVCIDEKTREEFLSWMRAFPHLRYSFAKVYFGLNINHDLLTELLERESICRRKTMNEMWLSISRKLLQSIHQCNHFIANHLDY